MLKVMIEKNEHVVRPLFLAFENDKNLEFLMSSLEEETG